MGLPPGNLIDQKFHAEVRLKYTFINIAGHEQTVDVPQEYIDRTRKSLHCSVEEACDLYVYDEGLTEDETANELNAKADTQKKRKGPARKEDPIKRDLIEYLRKMIVKTDTMLDADFKVSNVTIINPERIVQFKINDDVYEVTLSRKRKPKA